MKLKYWFGAVVLAGCAAGGRTGDPFDLSSAASGDLSSGGSDLSSARDLTEALADLLPPADLSAAVDMAAPADMVAPADHATPPDLSLTGDLAGADLATCTPPVAGGQCDTWPQCGCAGSLACVVTDNTTGLTGCVASGTTSPYASCTGSGVAQCRAGYTCVNGVCQQFCNGSADCGGANRTCTQVTYMGSVVPQFNTCSRLCDPVNPALDDATYDPCGPGVACWPASAASSKASDCVGGITKAGVHGDDCSSTSGSTPDYRLCGPGTVCLADNILFSFVGHCYKFCHNPTNGPSAECPGSINCYHFSTALYAGATEIGFCNQ